MPLKVDLDKLLQMEATAQRLAAEHELAGRQVLLEGRCGPCNRARSLT